MKKIFFRILTLLLVLTMTASCQLSEELMNKEKKTEETTEEVTEAPTVESNTTRQEDPAPTPPTGKIKVACVGDSLTFGANATPYPTALQDLLGSEQYEVKNFGAEGRTMTLGLSDPPNMTDRSYYDSQPYKNSLAYQPDIVILCLGTNDAWRVDIASKEGKAGYVQGLLKLVDSYYYEVGVQQVYVCLPPDCVKNNIGNLVEEHVIPLIKANSNTLDYEIIDFFTPTKDRSDYLQSDLLHLNTQGYAVMAQVAFQALTSSDNGNSDAGDSGNSGNGNNSSTGNLIFSQVLEGEKIKDVYNFREKFQ